jgi:uncharacterized repeat protein (TIGR02543 family)
LKALVKNIGAAIAVAALSLSLVGGVAASADEVGGSAQSGPSAQDGGCAPFGGANLPDHVVNGDFEYPHLGTQPPVGITGDGNYWADIDPVYGYYGVGVGDDAVFAPLPGFCRSQFGWSSTENFNLPPLNKNDAQRVEFQTVQGNQVAEIVAEAPGTAIYQDVRTVPGAIYKWKLRHASRSKDHVDVMNVMLGQAGGALTAQTATRVSSNGLGDAIGPVGTRIATKINTPRVDSEFEWYEGSYTVPAGQTVTRFSFQSVDSMAPNGGNFIDDISFDVSYPLTFDPNGATGTTPERVSGVPSAGIGGCGTHHVAGENVALPTGAKDSDCWDSDMLTYPSPTSGKFAGQRAKFVGWSKDRHDPFLSEADAKAATIKDYQMPADGATLHAVWVWSSGSVDYDANAADATGSTAGSGVKDAGSSYTVAENGFTRPGFRFDGWTENADGTGKAYKPGDSILMPAGPTKLHAKWVPTGSVSFDGNAADVTGSTPGSGVKDAGSSFVVPDNGFIRPGFHFKGWSVNADGGGKVYQSGESMPIPEGSLVLHAVWEADPAVAPAPTPEDPVAKEPAAKDSPAGDPAGDPSALASTGVASWALAVVAVVFVVVGSLVLWRRSRRASGFED